MPWRPRRSERRPQNPAPRLCEFLPRPTPSLPGPSSVSAWGSSHTPAWGQQGTPGSHLWPEEPGDGPEAACHPCPAKGRAVPWDFPEERTRGSWSIQWPPAPATTLAAAQVIQGPQAGGHHSPVSLPAQPAQVRRPVSSGPRPGDSPVAPAWAIQPSCFAFQGSLGMVERFALYERAKKAFAVVATG